MTQAGIPDRQRLRDAFGQIDHLIVQLLIILLVRTVPLTRATGESTRVKDLVDILLVAEHMEVNGPAYKHRQSGSLGHAGGCTGTEERSFLMSGAIGDPVADVR